MAPHEFDYSARIERARRSMAEADLDGLLLSLGSDLRYLTGYEAMPLERLTLLVLTHQEAVLLVPRLEAPRVPPGPFETRPWDEIEDPVELAAAIAGNGRFGIGDQTWALFLLRLQKRMADAVFVSATPVMSALRIVKEEAELRRLREAARAVDRVIDRLVDVPMEGMSERQLARQVADWTVEEGHDSATFTIVAAGPNGASPHHESTDRVIGPGEVIVIDFGGRIDGYCSDVTRSFVTGEPTAEQEEVHRVVLRAQTEAARAAQPGLLASDVDRVARRVIEDAGYGEYFIHRTGHGIGLDTHEDPYLVEGSTTHLEPGMTFSVEPGIYLPGRFGVRIEDIVIVTESGSESLNRSGRSLHRV